MFFSWNNDMLTLRILGTAGAKHEWWGKVVGDEIKLSVKTAPENGKATQYMQKRLAKEFGVPQKHILLVSWLTSPYKVFQIVKPKKIPVDLQEYGVVKRI